MSINFSAFAGAGAQFSDSNGAPLTGGLLYVYAAGTSTPVTTYTSREATANNTNPIVLDAAGRTPAEIWLDGGLFYKFVLKSSTYVQIGSYDNIPAINDVTTVNNLLTVTGTNTLTALGVPTIQAYTTGAQYSFVAQNNNTSAVTINIDALGAKSITKAGAVPLSAGDIVATAAYIVIYDGTRFQLMTRTSASQLVLGTTAERPASPTSGMIRMNSTTNNPEWYDATTSSWLNFSQPAGYSVDYLVQSGGGGGGSASGGGGGAGGLLASTITLSSGVPYTITVGSGGAGGTASANGASGTASAISVIAVTSVGGGGGGGNTNSGLAGGSGGGAAQVGTGGAATSGQGNTGGNGANQVSGGGGGAGAVGANGVTSSAAGAGGVGSSKSISGAPVFYAGGGGGGALNGSLGAGGNGGGGSGGQTSVGSAGNANTGGGGGGGGGSGAAYAGGNGGSGIVIIRYLGSQRGTGGTITSAGGYTIHTFTSSSTYNA